MLNKTEWEINIEHATFNIPLILKVSPSVNIPNLAQASEQEAYGVNYHATFNTKETKKMSCLTC